MEEKLIYSCAKHIDDAIDDFINETETFPTVTKEENSICTYCAKEAEYCVSNDK